MNTLEEEKVNKIRKELIEKKNLFKEENLEKDIIELDSSFL